MFTNVHLIGSKEIWIYNERGQQIFLFVNALLQHLFRDKFSNKNTRSMSTKLIYLFLNALLQ